jgi:DNA-binding NtrC family response regulator
MSAMPGFVDSGAALIASPSSAFRAHVMHRLNGRCRPVQQVHGGADALAQLESGGWRVLFLDRRLPDLDAEELLATVEKRFPGIQVVLLDSEAGREEENGGVEMQVVRAMNTNRVSSILLGETAGTGITPLPGMIGSSAAMQRVYRMARLVAPRSTTVLIGGATGTGKELVARALHALSPRAQKSLVVVNCAAIPEALLESELFGYRRGAFTGAVQSQLGRIPAAHGGTLFLDEVSELPLAMQAKLLRFLEQKEVQSLGTCEVSHVDVRVLAASNLDLAERAASGEFRRDLFYRLSAFPIELPALAERTEDIGPLAEHFLSCMGAALDVPVPRLSEEALRMLQAHGWPGNVRELQHVMERASILVENGETITEEHLYFPYSHGRAQRLPIAPTLERSYAPPRQLA